MGASTFFSQLFPLPSEHRGGRIVESVSDLFGRNSDRGLAGAGGDGLVEHGHVVGIHDLKMDLDLLARTTRDNSHTNRIGAVLIEDLIDDFFRVRRGGLLPFVHLVQECLMFILQLVVELGELHELFHFVLLLETSNFLFVFFFDGVQLRSPGLDDGLLLGNEVFQLKDSFPERLDDFGFKIRLWFPNLDAMLHDGEGSPLSDD